MKKTMLIITVMLVITSCDYNPKDLEYITVPIKVLALAQQTMAEDTTLVAGDLFIIPGPSIARWDYIFIIDPKTQNLAVDSVYPTTDPNNSIGLAILITVLVAGVMGGAIGYKINEG